MLSAEEAEQELVAYRAVTDDRDPMVRRALQAGVSKNRIHVLSGIARTTIARIPQEDPVSPVRVTALTDPTYLHLHYSGTDGAQPAYLNLDLPTATLNATVDAEPGSPTRQDEHTGHRRRYPIPALTAQAANRVMHDIRDLATRVVSDWDVRRNSQGTIVVQLGHDAQAAEDEIVQRLGCEDADPGYADYDLIHERAADEIEDLDRYGLTAASTNANLKTIEQEILAELAAESGGLTVVCHRLEEMLQVRRDELANPS